MTPPSRRRTADIADAIRAQAVAAGMDTPAVRGADWRQAIVQTVGSDGTVTTTDGVIARRLETYQNAAVNDRIVITLSGSGNWLAVGRMLTTGDPAWATYTPSWLGSTTNPSIGNGTLTGRYTLIGKTCHAAVIVIPGSTTAFGSGTYTFGVPFMSADDAVAYLGVARLTSGSTYIGQVNLGAGGTVANATFPASTTDTRGANMSQIAPATFANGNILRMSLTYQIA
ncbi:hypothetical protein NLX86_18750 [Streptomyces sp. A3M-1-3]|uniref:hypothetical protein n=1 Tax=Streptomyces sp. A3M-1-3 TaxID=2962044 RepID=UPI0020B81FDA|nr:hypothetical protein [Streptomyces sp. A3M-1-3]MCP3820057.1 hypothetical protein [Streptomyces sp. A3M-1-3]